MAGSYRRSVRLGFFTRHVPPPQLKRFARSFPFIVTRSPTQRLLIGHWSDPQKYATSPDKILFGSQNPFKNGNAKSSDFRSEEEDKLKTFILPLVFQEGPCEGITGGTSCSIGEAKGGVKT